MTSTSSTTFLSTSSPSISTCSTTSRAEDQQHTTSSSMDEQDVGHDSVAIDVARADKTVARGGKSCEQAGGSTSSVSLQERGQPPHLEIIADQIVAKKRKTTALVPPGGSNSTRNKHPPNKAERYRASGFSTKPEQELWMGGIPQRYASVRQLRQLIWENLVTDEEKRWTVHVKKLVKKGYRKNAAEPWTAFAILALKTKAEAERVLEILNNRVLVKGEDRIDDVKDEDFKFFLRARQVTKPMTSSGTKTNLQNGKGEQASTTSDTWGRGSYINASDADKKEDATTFTRPQPGSAGGEQLQAEAVGLEESTETFSPEHQAPLYAGQSPPLFNRLMALPLEQLVERWRILSEVIDVEDVDKVQQDTEDTNGGAASSSSSLSVCKRSTNSGVDVAPVAKMKTQTTTNSGLNDFDASLSALISTLKLELKTALDFGSSRGPRAGTTNGMKNTSMISTSNSKGPIARALARIQEFCESRNLTLKTVPTSTPDEVADGSPLGQINQLPDSPHTSCTLFATQHLTGRCIPEPLCTKLHEELKRLQWPVQKHRQRLKSDHYAVVWRGRPRAEFQQIYPLFEELMDWAGDREPSPGHLVVPWTHIAVTKNFIGSPHIDEFDQTFQFCASFGDFENGGELCVEDCNVERWTCRERRIKLLKGNNSTRKRQLHENQDGHEEETDERNEDDTPSPSVNEEDENIRHSSARISCARTARDVEDFCRNNINDDPRGVDDPPNKLKHQAFSTLYICTTKNRLVKVDGRYVHFVRGYDQQPSDCDGGANKLSGDRYSLVFYCLDPKGYTPKRGAVDWEWMARSSKS
ncbi:unnamed protein product [Amoebophrya sp. A120]|nr:unnamed protein product [Amoebophrya sp. A120]|eukprot:GSA120T00007154001.1